jgi:putative spermidine/putrescine transport system ATP-binding protein
MPIQSLEFADVGKAYARGAVGLQGFSLTVRGGEFITLLGPSGCGKTTALNCLAGLIPLSSGAIRLDGRRVDLDPPERRGFGMVFQNYALFPHLTVEKNVAFGLELRKLPASQVQSRVRQALGLVQLEPSRFAQRYPRELSGGQQQRLALARAVVLEPRVLLLDEPLSNLDAKLRADMRLELKRLHRQLELTSVYVTHDQAEALSLSDRVVVMRDGRIEQVGTPEEVYRRPATLFVADFLGFKNRLPVWVQRADGQETLLSGPGGIQLRSTLGAQVPAGTEAIACFRPEDVELAPNGSQQLTAEIELVEFLGQEYEAEARLFSTGDGARPWPLLLRSPQPVRRGDTLSVHIPPERVAVFPAPAAEAG